MKPLAFRVLLKLANVANPEGRNAWRSKHELASELGVDARSIQRALRELEGANLIRRGDQKFVSHIRAGYRPTVYDIVMKRPAQGGLQTIDDGLDAEPEARGDTVIHNPIRGDMRGDTDSSTEELKNYLPRLNNEALDPAARATLLRGRCVPPFKTHEYAPNGICTHGCGCYANGRVEDPRTGLVLLEADEVRA
ncbi:MAG TPA: helix-turn-helix domain-containing protein [Protaetiibacter sp.]|nr:helix-turn-helix domain-containing protein [Protaetiibacter sp.]